MIDTEESVDIRHGIANANLSRTQITAEMFRRNETRMKSNSNACAYEDEALFARAVLCHWMRNISTGYKNIRDDRFVVLIDSCIFHLAIRRARIGQLRWKKNRCVSDKKYRSLPSYYSCDVDSTSHLNGALKCWSFFSLCNLHERCIHRKRSASNLSYGRPSCRHASRVILWTWD